MTIRRVIVALCRDLRHLAAKNLAGEGVHGEADAAPVRVDLRDVDFVDRGPHLRLSTLPTRKRLDTAAAGSAPAHVDAAVDDDALDRRADRGIAEFDFRAFRAALFWATAASATSTEALANL